MTVCPRCMEIMKDMTKTNTDNGNTIDFTTYFCTNCKTYSIIKIGHNPGNCYYCGKETLIELKFNQPEGNKNDV